MDKGDNSSPSPCPCHPLLEMTALLICQQSHRSNHPQTTASSMARVRTALFRQPWHRRATSRAGCHQPPPSPGMAPGDSSCTAQAKTDPCRDSALKETKVRGGCPEFGAKPKQRALMSEGWQLFQDAPATHRCWNVDPWTADGSSRGVPSLRYTPCSVLQSHPGRKDEEVRVQRGAAWLTCTGWPLRQPWGHRVPLQGRLLR